MPRWGGKRKRPKTSRGLFESRQPAPPVPAAPAETPEDGNLSPMEGDDELSDGQDEDWHNEDAGAASGGSQATLPFGYAAAASVVSAASRAAQSLCPEIAPLRRAAQPHRSTLHRRKQTSLGAAKPKMASFMSSWLEGSLFTPYMFVLLT